MILRLDQSLERVPLILGHPISDDPFIASNGTDRKLKLITHNQPSFNERSQYPGLLKGTTRSAVPAPVLLNLPPTRVIVPGNPSHQLSLQ